MNKEIEHGEESDYKTPEYWCGHGFFDGCSHLEIKGEFDWRAHNFAENVLEEFLETQTQKEAHSRIDKGQDFSVYQYQPGTIVRFQTEEYFDINQLNSGDWTQGSLLSGTAIPPSINEYERNQHWGVVTPLTKKPQERTLVKFGVIDDPRLANDRLFPVKHTRPTPLVERFQVGEVYHFNSRLLIRTEWLEIVKLGGGIKTPPMQAKGTIFSRFFSKPITG